MAATWEWDITSNGSPTVQSVTYNKGAWRAHENVLLKEMVAKTGTRNWSRISTYVRTRSAKQCRERWHQCLNPRLNHAPITREEGEVILDWIARIGMQWAKIARQLKGRSDNAVKNWYHGRHGVLNRRKRKEKALNLQRQRASQLQQEDTNRVSSPVTSFARPSPSVGYPSLPCPSGNTHRRSNRALPPCSSHHGECDGNVNHTTSPAAKRSSASNNCDPPKRPIQGKCVWYEGGVPVESLKGVQGLQDKSEFVVEGP
ncbi:hypothetical protein E4U17_003869 [Claviceps sp. LM77 group G4]|nr:hypothetical protein E4U17_003869 [Claviceps sp. LM77 group G4]